MHLCFLDESGSPPKPGKVGNRPYSIIAAVVMHEAQWHGVADEVRQLRARPEYQVTGEIKWRYFGPDNTDPDNSVAHLSKELKDKFRLDLFAIITKRKSIKIIACCACAEAAYETSYVKDQEDLYHYTYKPVYERFQYYLQDVSRTVGDRQHGIIVADHRGKKQDEMFRKGRNGLVDANRMFASNYENFIESIFLTPSHHSVGIQLADMVAGAIGRAFNTDEKTFANALEPAFHKSPQGKIEGFGLVKFPKKRLEVGRRGERKVPDAIAASPTNPIWGTSRLSSS